jgi:hypothetical protein
MSSVLSLSSFHHWLLDGKPDLLGHLRVIVLHGAKEFPELADSIAHYLNEYDDQADGHWIAPSTQLIDAIAADPAQRRLLGIDQPCEKCPPTGPCGLRKVIKGLALHGHVVLDSIHAATATDAVEGIFHVSLGAPHKNCHMHLNAERFKRRCLAPIIGDVYLEWIRCCFCNSDVA